MERAAVEPHVRKSVCRGASVEQGGIPPPFWRKERKPHTEQAYSKHSNLLSFSLFHFLRALHIIIFMLPGDR